ncbi:hypothetical protein JYU02_01580 [bacterium AH-315-P15]|nr:hypothetical protein [bacterium AH-315-P15]
MSDPTEIAQYQTRTFNAMWREASEKVPFYKMWRKRHRLPIQIGGLRELADFPRLLKSDIIEHDDLIKQTPDTKRFTLTGGTSGLSTAFPMNRLDADSSWVNAFVGRAWNGIYPFDSLYMMWGHSHLFGGHFVRLKQARRKIFDALNNIRRVSAYDLTSAQLDFVARDIKARRPKYIIGYGSCLALLAQHIEIHAGSLSHIGIHRVVNTSESLDDVDAQRLSKVFGCPVINEYGMAEAGVVGYSKGDAIPIAVFWQDFIVGLKKNTLMLTTIGDRCFPLVNYDTEDICNDRLPDEGTLLSLSSLGGKARDVFEITDKAGEPHLVSVVLFDHILKQVPDIRSAQYTLRKSGVVEIGYTSFKKGTDEQVLRAQFAEGLRKEGVEIDPSILEFSIINKPLQTTAGKRWALVRSSE